MAKLIWSDKVVAALEDIYDYIAADSPFYARYQVEKITNSIERLQAFPESGRHLPEFPQLQADYFAEGSLGISISGCP